MDDGGVDLRRRSASVALERQIAKSWTLQIAGGASIDGDIVESDTAVRHVLKPGPIAVVGAAYRILDGHGQLPFMLFGVALSFASTKTESTVSDESARLSALDARASFTIGKLFGGVIAPYGAVRAFGGPVFWQRGGEHVIGGDVYHFQIGAGLLATTGRVDGFFELMPAGERSATVGVALAL